MNREILYSTSISEKEGTFTYFELQNTLHQMPLFIKVNSLEVTHLLIRSLGVNSEADY